MSVNLRYPNITGLSEKEQIAQIKSYLHQLVEQLNYTLPNLESGESESPSASAQSDDLSYTELRAFVIQELQEIENQFDKLSTKMQSEYVSDEELPDAIEDALAQAKDSGEFDGPQGIQGEKGDTGDQGPKGDPGDDGYTPIKGVDYFTEGEINSVATQAAGKILFTLDDDGNLYYEVEE